MTLNEIKRGILKLFKRRLAVFDLPSVTLQQTCRLTHAQCLLSGKMFFFGVKNVAVIFHFGFL